MQSYERQRVILPTPRREAYFPKSKVNDSLVNLSLERAGRDNLVMALEYGSHVTGDASPTSMRDIILIVDDANKFHRRNMEISKTDYGSFRSVPWHSFLNDHGLSYYHTTFRDGEHDTRVKYAVISKSNFIKGCNGTLRDKEKNGYGAFGFYVAGRVQKAPLRPLYKGDVEKMSGVEEAINTARIDGFWLALGLVKDTFSLERLMATYTVLSYKADLRPERKGKLLSLVLKNKSLYMEMLTPIIYQFMESGLIEKVGDGKFSKNNSLTREEVEKRLNQIKINTIANNYIRNVLTAGLLHGLIYAWQKLKRSRAHK